MSDLPPPPFPPWRTKVEQFMAEYNLVRSLHPDWKIEQIAAQLQKGTTTTRLMLIVAKHLDDPKIASAPNFSAAYEIINSYDKPWQAYITDLHDQYIRVQQNCPVWWTSEDIAKHLNKSLRTINRMLTVYRQLSDPKIANLSTLNKAYNKIKNNRQDRTTETKNQITNVMDSMVQTGSEKP